MKEDTHRNGAYTQFPIVTVTPVTFKDNHLANATTIFLISISKVQFSNCSTDPTYNIIQIAMCYGLKTIKAIVQQIGDVFKFVFTRMFLKI